MVWLILDNCILRKNNKYGHRMEGVNHSERGIEMADQKKQNPATPPVRTRRKLIAVLGAGAALNLPKKWATPLVDSVMLPAHGVTSGTGTTPSPKTLCPSLIIPGFSFDCSTPEASNFTAYYAVDVGGPCPAILEVGLSHPLAMRVSVQLFVSTDIFTEASISASGLDLTGVHKLSGCGSTPSTSNIPSSGVEGFDASDGTPWTATYSVTGDVTGVTVSDIILAPA
jgi:hypothetical protein